MVMLRKWLGDEDFAAGLALYFKRHQYGNTVGDNLWDALAEVSERCGSFMHSWVNQLVTLSLQQKSLMIL